MEIHELVRLLRSGASDRDAVKLLGLNLPEPPFG
jgi:hypothetical protein